MDFSALISELRNIANKYHGRDTDANVSTAMYCEMFRKILQKADMGTSRYGDQIVILWMTLSQLCNTAGALSSCSARDSLYQHIFLLCAKTVLNIKWQQLDEDDQSKQNLRATVEATHGQLQLAGFDRFGLLLQLMDDPWTDPVLSQIMSGEESDSEQATEYISKEDSLILKLRVEMLIQENCEEFALNLCESLLQHEKFKDDLDLIQKQLFLLFKLSNKERFQEVCEKIVCHTGIKIILKMEQKESNQAICVRLIQTFLVQDWVNPERNCCTQELLKLWIRHQYLADKDKEKFIDSVWAIAKLSCNTEQISVLVTGLLKECGLSLLQLYTDLLVFAINFDKGQLEQEMLKGNMLAVKNHQHKISHTCRKLAEIYTGIKPKIARVCSLTAFALNASGPTLLAVKKIFCDDSRKVHGMGLCRSDCSSPECRRKKFIFGKPDRKSKEDLHKDNVNPASLHEIERLLNMLRPYYLNPELPWLKLSSLCYKFLAEKGVVGDVSSKEKEQTIVKEGQQSKSILSGCVQYFCDDTGQFIPYRAKPSTQSQETISNVNAMQNSATVSYDSTMTPNLATSAVATVHNTITVPSSLQVYSNLLQRTDVKTTVHQRTAAQHSVAELLAQTAVPSSAKIDRPTMSPLSLDLANLQRQIRLSKMHSETANKSKTSLSVKPSKPIAIQSVQTPQSSDMSAKRKEQSHAIQSAFNLISLEEIKKQLRDAQIANANTKIAVKIPGAVQAGSSNAALLVQPSQILGHRAQTPKNIKVQPRPRGRPNILSAGQARSSGQLSQQMQSPQVAAIQTLAQKQGSIIKQAMHIGQNSLQIQPTTVDQVHSVGQAAIQAGSINQGLAILQAKSSNQATSPGVLNVSQGVSHNPALSVKQILVNQNSASMPIIQKTFQQPNTVLNTLNASPYDGLLQQPVQITTVRNVGATSGSNVFNFMSGSAMTQSNANQVLVMTTASSSENPNVSSTSQHVFGIKTASDRLSSIKPPSATITSTKSTTDWSVVKPPASSLHVVNNSQLKTASKPRLIQVNTASTSSGMYPPYQGQSLSSGACASENRSQSLKMVETGETIPTDVVSLVQEAGKQANKDTQLQPPSKCTERRPSADELKSIVDWLQTGTEDAVNKPPSKPLLSINEAIRNKVIRKPNIKSPFEQATVSSNLILTPPQTALTIQSYNPLHFVQSTTAGIVNTVSSSSQKESNLAENIRIAHGSKPFVVSTHTNSQEPVSAHGTVISTGNQIGVNPQSSKASEVALSNIVGSNNLATAVLFPFNAQNLNSGNIGQQSVSKPPQSGGKQLLYLGHVKASALSTGQHVLSTESAPSTQQWPEIQAVMSSAKKFVESYYTAKNTTAAVPHSQTSLSVEETTRGIHLMKGSEEDNSKTHSVSVEDSKAPSETGMSNANNTDRESPVIENTSVGSEDNYFNRDNAVQESDPERLTTLSQVVGDKQTVVDNSASASLLEQGLERDPDPVQGEDNLERRLEIPPISSAHLSNKLNTSIDSDCTEKRQSEIENKDRNIEMGTASNEELEYVEVSENVMTVDNSVRLNTNSSQVNTTGSIISSEKGSYLQENVVSAFALSKQLSDFECDQATSEGGKQADIVNDIFKNEISDDPSNITKTNTETVQLTKNTPESVLLNAASKYLKDQPNISSEILVEPSSPSAATEDEEDLVDPLKCLICETVFSTVENLKSHVKDICKPTGETSDFKCVYYCSNCSYSSESKAYMGLHIRNCENTIYAEQNIPNIYKRFCCKMCGQICLGKDQVKEHTVKECELRKNTSVVSDEIDSENIGINEKANLLKSGPFKSSDNQQKTKDRIGGVVPAENVRQKMYEDENESVNVDGDTTDDLDSDYEMFRKSSNEEAGQISPSKKQLKKWFLRNKESKSYVEMEENSEEELSSEDEVKSKKTSEDEVKSKKNNEGNVVKRKRGRPRLDGSEVKEKRKRGRPRIYFKGENEIPNVKRTKLSHKEEVKEKRKRGRPRLDSIVLAERKKKLKERIKERKERPKFTGDNVEKVVGKVHKRDIPICYGKRIIKVAKFYSDEFEMPDYVKSQAEKYNRIRMSDENIKCLKCGQMFRDHNVMLQHVASVHLSPYKSTWFQKKMCFQCRYCHKPCNTYIKFLDHVTVHSKRLLKQLEGRTSIKGKINRRKLARQKQISALSIDVDKSDGEKESVEREVNDEKENAKERLSRSSRASSVSSCDTESSRRTRSKSRQKLDFSDIGEDSSESAGFSVKTRHRNYSNTANETTSDSGEKSRTVGSQSDSVSSVKKSRQSINDKNNDFNDGDDIGSEKLRVTDNISSDDHQIAERIISTRGKIYRLGEIERMLDQKTSVNSPDNDENDADSSCSAKEETSLKMEQETTKCVETTSESYNKTGDSDSDSKKDRFSKRTISTRKKTYVYDESNDLENKVDSKDDQSDAESVVSTDFKRTISTRKKTYVYDESNDLDNKLDSKDIPSDAAYVVSSDFKRTISTRKKTYVCDESNDLDDKSGKRDDQSDAESVVNSDFKRTISTRKKTYVCDESNDFDNKLESKDDQSDAESVVSSDFKRTISTRKKTYVCDESNDFDSKLESKDDQSDAESVVSSDFKRTISTRKKTYVCDESNNFDSKLESKDNQSDTESVVSSDSKSRSHEITRKTDASVESQKMSVVGSDSKCRSRESRRKSDVNVESKTESVFSSDSQFRGRESRRKSSASVESKTETVGNSDSKSRSCESRRKSDASVELKTKSVVSSDSKFRYHESRKSDVSVESTTESVVSSDSKSRSRESRRKSVASVESKTGSVVSSNPKSRIPESTRKSDASVESKTDSVSSDSLFRDRESRRKSSENVESKADSVVSADYQFRDRESRRKSNASVESKSDSVISLDSKSRNREIRRKSNASDESKTESVFGLDSKFRSREMRRQSDVGSKTELESRRVKTRSSSGNQKVEEKHLRNEASSQLSPGNESDDKITSRTRSSSGNKKVEEKHLKIETQLSPKSEVSSGLSPCIVREDKITFIQTRNRNISGTNSSTDSNPPTKTFSKKEKVDSSGKNMGIKRLQSREKLISNITLRKRNLRSSFCSKYERFGVPLRGGLRYGVRTHRLCSRNERKELIMRKSRRAKIVPRTNTISKENKESVEHDVHESDECEINDDKGEEVIEDQDEEKEVPLKSKRLSEEEMLVAACLESSRTLRVNLERNTAYDDIKKEAAQMFDSKLKGNPQVEIEELITNRRVLRDRRKLRLRDMEFDSDYQTNDSDNDEDYQVDDSEEEEESDEVSDVEEIPAKRKCISRVQNIKFIKNNPETEQKDKLMISVEVDDEEFAYVKSPVLDMVAENASGTDVKHKSVEQRDSKKSDLNQAFLESFKSYIDTSKQSHLHTAIKKDTIKGEGIITTVIKSVVDKAETQNSNSVTKSDFLDSFKVYIDKKLKVKGEADKDVSKETGKVKKSTKSSETAPRSGTVVKNSTTNADPNWVPDRKRFLSGTRQETSTKKRFLSGGDKEEKDDPGKKLSDSDRDYLSNFKKYIDTRCDQSSDTDNEDTVKESEDSATETVENSRSKLDTDSTVSISETIEKMPASEEKSLNREHLKIQNKTGGYSFLDSFLAHCGKTKEPESYSSESEYASDSGDNRKQAVISKTKNGGESRNEGDWNSKSFEWLDNMQMSTSSLKSGIRDKTTELETDINDKNMELEKGINGKNIELQSGDSDKNRELESGVGNKNMELECGVSDNNREVESDVIDENKDLESGDSDKNRELESDVSDKNREPESGVVDINMQASAMEMESDLSEKDIEIHQFNETLEQESVVQNANSPVVIIEDEVDDSELNLNDQKRKETTKENIDEVCIVLSDDDDSQPENTGTLGVLSSNSQTVDENNETCIVLSDDDLKQSDAAVELEKDDLGKMIISSNVEITSDLGASGSQEQKISSDVDQSNRQVDSSVQNVLVDIISEVMKDHLQDENVNVAYSTCMSGKIEELSQFDATPDGIKEDATPVALSDDAMKQDATTVAVSDDTMKQDARESNDATPVVSSNNVEKWNDTPTIIYDETSKLNDATPVMLSDVTAKQKIGTPVVLYDEQMEQEDVAPVTLSDELSKLPDQSSKRADVPPVMLSDDEVKQNDATPVMLSDHAVKQNDVMPVVLSDGEVKQNDVTPVMLSDDAVKQNNVTPDAVKQKDVTPVMLSDDEVKQNDVTLVVLSDDAVKQNDVTPDAVKQKDVTPVMLSDDEVKQNDDTSVMLSDDEVKQNDDTPVMLSDDEVKQNDGQPVMLSDDEVKQNDDTPVMLSDDEVKQKDVTPVMLSDDEVKQIDVTPVMLSDDAVKQNDVTPVMLSDDEVKQKDVTPVMLSDDAVKQYDDTPVMLSDDEVKQNDVTPIMLSDDAVNQNDVTPVMLSDDGVKQNDVTPVMLSEDEVKQNDVTPVEVKQNDNTSVMLSDDEVKQNDDTPVMLSDDEVKQNNITPVMLSDDEVKQKDVTPVMLSDDAVNQNDVTPVMLSNDAVKQIDVTPVMLSDDAVNQNDVTPVMLSDDSLKQDNMPTILYDKTSKPNDATPAVISVSERTDLVQHNASLELDYADVTGEIKKFELQESNKESPIDISSAVETTKDVQKQTSNCLLNFSSENETSDVQKQNVNCMSDVSTGMETSNGRQENNSCMSNVSTGMETSNKQQENISCMSDVSSGMETSDVQQQTISCMSDVSTGMETSVVQQQTISCMSDVSTGMETSNVQQENISCMSDVSTGMETHEIISCISDVSTGMETSDVQQQTISCMSDVSTGMETSNVQQENISCMSDVSTGMEASNLQGQSIDSEVELSNEIEKSDLKQISDRSQVDVSSDIGNLAVQVQQTVCKETKIVKPSGQTLNYSDSVTYEIERTNVQGMNVIPVIEVSGEMDMRNLLEQNISLTADAVDEKEIRKVEEQIDTNDVDMPSEIEKSDVEEDSNSIVHVSNVMKVSDSCGHVNSQTNNSPVNSDTNEVELIALQEQDIGPAANLSIEIERRDLQGLGIGSTADVSVEIEKGDLHEQDIVSTVDVSVEIEKRNLPEQDIGSASGVSIEIEKDELKEQDIVSTADVSIEIEKRNFPEQDIGSASGVSVEIEKDELQEQDMGSTADVSIGIEKGDLQEQDMGSEADVSIEIEKGDLQEQGIGSTADVSVEIEKRVLHEQDIVSTADVSIGIEKGDLQEQDIVSTADVSVEIEKRNLPEQDIGSTSGVPIEIEKDELQEQDIVSTADVSIGIEKGDLQEIDMGSGADVSVEIEKGDLQKQDIESTADVSVEIEQRDLQELGIGSTADVSVEIEKGVLHEQGIVSTADVSIGIEKGDLHEQYDMSEDDGSGERRGSSVQGKGDIEQVKHSNKLENIELLCDSSQEHVSDEMDIFSKTDNSRKKEITYSLEQNVIPGVDVSNEMETSELQEHMMTSNVDRSDGMESGDFQEQIIASNVDLSDEMKKSELQEQIIIATINVSDGMETSVQEQVITANVSRMDGLQRSELQEHIVTADINNSDAMETSKLQEQIITADVLVSNENDNFKKLNVVSEGDMSIQIEQKAQSDNSRDGSSHGKALETSEIDNQDTDQQHTGEIQSDSKQIILEKEDCIVEKSTFVGSLHPIDGKNEDEMCHRTDNLKSVKKHADTKCKDTSKRTPGKMDISRVKLKKPEESEKSPSVITRHQKDDKNKKGHYLKADEMKKNKEADLKSKDRDKRIPEKQDVPQGRLKKQQDDNIEKSTSVVTRRHRNDKQKEETNQKSDQLKTVEKDADIKSKSMEKRNQKKGDVTQLQTDSNRKRSTSVVTRNKRDHETPEGTPLKTDVMKTVKRNADMKSDNRSTEKKNVTQVKSKPDLKSVSYQSGIEKKDVPQGKSKSELKSEKKDVPQVKSKPEQKSVSCHSGMENKDVPQGKNKAELESKKKDVPQVKSKPELKSVSPQVKTKTELNSVICQSGSEKEDVPQVTSKPECKTATPQVKTKPEHKSVSCHSVTENKDVPQGKSKAEIETKKKDVPQVKTKSELKSVSPQVKTKPEPKSVSCHSGMENKDVPQGKSKPELDSEKKNVPQVKTKQELKSVSPQVKNKPEPKSVSCHSGMENKDVPQGKSKPELELKLKDVPQVKSKPELKSVSCQSGPATVRIPVQDKIEVKKPSVRNKGVMVSELDTRKRTYHGRPATKIHTVISTKSAESSSGKISPVLELPLELIDKSSVQLPDLPKSPIDSFQDNFENYSQSPSTNESESLGLTEDVEDSEEMLKSELKKLRDRKTSALKSLREHVSDIPFTWDMDETPECSQNVDKIKKIKMDEPEKLIVNKNEQNVDQSVKPKTPDLIKSMDTTHQDDAASCVSDDTKSVCSSVCSDHADNESGRSSRTSSVERIIPRTQVVSKPGKVRHIYHDGKIWNIGKGQVTSVPVHQIEEIVSEKSDSCDSTVKHEVQIGGHRHGTRLHVIEVDRKHDQDGKHVKGATSKEKYDDLNTYKSREVTDVKKQAGDEKPARKWKIEQGKRKDLIGGSVSYPYVFKKSRRK